MVPLFGFLFLDIMIPSSSDVFFRNLNILKDLLVKDGSDGGILSAKFRGSALAGFDSSVLLSGLV